MDQPAKKEIKNLLFDTKIKKIMTTKVHAIHERDEFSKAVQLFNDHSLTHLPVITDHNKVVGLLSHMYIYKTQAPRRFVEGEMTAAPDMIMDGDGFYLKETLDRFQLKKIMKLDPLTLNQEESLAVAVHVMANKRIGCVPVVDDQKNLVGILTNQDVISFLGIALS